ncbi:MAG: methionyl-tRNA formyltransferase [Candidatus Acidiferrales bacterium]
MRIVFCGTPQFAVPTLKHLLAQPDFEIVGVISQPDRPRGRGQMVSPSPVKAAAFAASLPVHQPEKIRSAEARELLQKLAPDGVVIIAYGQIIPALLLSIPKFGWINLHASLLPKYRGAAPINWAIANGETETGVTTMRIDAGMDTGEILLQREIPIGVRETAPQLSVRLAEAGAPLMEETLRGLMAGKIMGRTQDGSRATYAPLLKKEDGRVDWSCSAKEIFDRMRGFAPWPGAYTTHRGQTCHVWGEPASQQMRKETIEDKPGVAPGTLLQEKGELHVVCGGTTVLRILTVKVEGRKQVTAAEFANGARLKTGERFGIT